MGYVKQGGISAILIGAVVAIWVLYGGYFLVNPGEVALKIRMGKVVNSYDEGFYLKIPFVDAVKKFSIRIKRSDISTDAFSKDLQTVKVDVVVNFRIEKKTVVSIYRNLGINYENTIINPIVQEEIKSVISRYTAEAIIGNRFEVTKAISKVVKERLLDKQIIITDISITNFDFTPDFLKSVEDKQIAEQNAKKALKDVERVRNESQQEIIKAQAQAKALELQKNSVSGNLIKLRKVEAQLKAIDKWDGRLPYYNGGAMPFVQIQDTNK